MSDTIAEELEETTMFLSKTLQPVLYSKHRVSCSTPIEPAITLGIDLIMHHMTSASRD